MIPMADNLNHSHITVINETVHRTLHIEGDQHTKYWTRDKFMNDYSELYSHEEITKTPANIMGRFNRETYRKNVLKYSLEAWQENIKSQQIWELDYKEEDYDEDNDTSEEEEEDEVLEIGEESKGKVTKDLLNPRKGFRFFIQEEQKLLAHLDKKRKQHQQLQQIIPIQPVESEKKVEEQESSTKTEKVVDLTA